MSTNTMMLLAPEPSSRPESQSSRSKDNEGEQATPTSSLIIFRAKDSRAPTTKMPHLALNQVEPSAEPVYHGRRPHRKSRTGCANCKKRRVKCDETRPNCRKCQIFGIPCDYLVAQAQLSRSADSSLAHNVVNHNVLESSMHSMAMSDLGSRIDQVLRLATASDESFNSPHTFAHSKALKALHYFVNVVSEQPVAPQAAREVMSGDMVRVALNSPYVMHALLGLANTHLHHCSPDGISYRMAHRYHWHNTIRLYKKELASPIGPHNMDPLVSTCLMLAVFSFSAEKFRPADSWVFSSNPTALNWLLMQGGLKYILTSIAPYLGQSIWYKALNEAAIEDRIFDHHTSGREELHPELADLCEIDETTAENDNPYLRPLRILSPILALESTTENMRKLTSFAGNLPSKFTNLLLQKDPKALVILSYWLAKLCPLKQWYIRSRVWTECTAICMYLESSSDSKILKLLESPAESCGYLLRHVKEEALFVANFDLIGVF